MAKSRSDLFAPSKRVSPKAAAVARIVAERGTRAYDVSRPNRLNVGHVTPNADVPGVTYDPAALDVEAGSNHPLRTFVNATLGPDLTAHVPGVYHEPGAGKVLGLEALQ